MLRHLLIACLLISHCSASAKESNTLQSLVKKGVFTEATPFKNNLKKFEQFAARHRLTGMTRQQIAQEFGKPDYVTQHEHYITIPMKSGPAFTFLSVEYSEHGQVNRFSMDHEIAAVRTFLYLSGFVGMDRQKAHSLLGAPARTDIHESHQLVTAPCGNGCADVEFEYQNGRVTACYLHKGWENEPTPIR